MLQLDEEWVWDFWTVEHDGETHLFFLHAPRALGDPDLRHRSASIGHAVSRDLMTWTRLPDALDAGPGEVATWTGSIARGTDGAWRMAWTILRDDPAPDTQTVAVAVSNDLVSWRRLPGEVRADPRWYATAALDGREPFRDPWLYSAEGRWHMLVTAAARGSDPRDGGVVGHAVSDDLEAWEVLPPLSEPGSGFGQLEVCQLIARDGMPPVLLFNCLAGDMTESRAGGGTGGIWSCPADGPVGPFRIYEAMPVTDDRLYVGKVVVAPGGDDVLLAFENRTGSGFGGRIVDPVPVRIDASGVIVTDP